MTTEHLVILCLFGWIPITALDSLIKTTRAGGAKGGTASIKQRDAMQVELETLRAELEQLRNTSTGFDISFDKRLSELELQARLARLKDIDANHGQQQSHHR